MEDQPGFGLRLREVFGNAKNVDIARKLGVSQAGVKNYLKGRVPGADTLVLIADLTGCSVHWLLTGKGPKFLTMKDRDEDTVPSGSPAVESPQHESGPAESDSYARILAAQNRVIIEQNNRIIEILEDVAQDRKTQ